MRERSAQISAQMLEVLLLDAVTVDEGVQGGRPSMYSDRHPMTRTCDRARTNIGVELK